MYTIEKISSEIVVIGGGLAGLRAAAAAAEEGAEVLLLTNGPSASPEVSGFSAPINPNDSIELCVKDIETSAEGICNKKLAQKLASIAIEEVSYFENLGFDFDKNEDGTYNCIQTLGASVPRLVHYQSSTGVKAMELLYKHCREMNVRFNQTATVLSLIPSNGKVVGVLYYDHAKKVGCICKCKAVIVATGGYGAIQKLSTYTKNIYGSGYAMAFNAGADMIDMEFQQFEPCTYTYPAKIAGKVMVTTLIRNGAKLYNGQMHEFMPDYGLTPENTQKGPLARAIASEVLAGRGTPHGGIYFDVRSLPDKLLFVDSIIFTKPCIDVGMDLHKDLPEVAPAGHTSLGGIRVNENCCSTVPNLFGCGEAIGGVHGANRIGGNAGAETLVFGRVAGKSAGNYVKSESFPTEAEFDYSAAPYIGTLLSRLDVIDGSVSIEELYNDIVNTMSTNVAIFRNEESLTTAKEELSIIEQKLCEVSISSHKEALKLYQCESMLLVSKMAVESSLLRKESRGVFFRSDYPNKDNEWTKNIIVHNNGGSPVIEVC